MTDPVSVDDGRLRRSARSREAVVDAILALLREGHMRPAASDIARRAGVSQRSVFRHFEDLEALFAEAADRQGARVAPYLLGLPVTGPFPDRMEALVGRLGALYEDIAPVRRAAVGHAPFHAAIRDRMADMHEAIRAVTEAVFVTELAAAESDVREALDVATSWATWDALRRDQRLSVARARAVVTALVTSLLAR